MQDTVRQGATHPPVTTPMDPVMVSGSATILLQAIACSRMAAQELVGRPGGAGEGGGLWFAKGRSSNCAAQLLVGLKKPAQSAAVIFQPSLMPLRPAGGAGGGPAPAIFPPAAEVLPGAVAAQGLQPPISSAAVRRPGSRRLVLPAIRLRGQAAAAHVSGSI